MTTEQRERLNKLIPKYQAWCNGGAGIGLPPFTGELIDLLLAEREGRECETTAATVHVPSMRVTYKNCDAEQERRALLLLMVAIKIECDRIGTSIGTLIGDAMALSARDASEGEK